MTGSIMYKNGVVKIALKSELEDQVSEQVLFTG